MEKDKRLPTENAEEKMFASSSNIGGYEDHGEPNREQDSRIQKQNLNIIKHILEMFNLEETKRKYETQDTIEYVLDPNEFGYDCSLSTTRVRQRLCDLMGTDVIRLNDKRYFQKLSQRLQEEYETHMDKQEDARCAAEEQRLRRLMLEGIINAPNDYRAVVHGERAKKPAKKKKKRKSKKKMADGFSAFPSEDTNVSLARHSEEEKTEKELVTQVSILSGAHPGSPGTKHTTKRPSFEPLPTSHPASKSITSEKENTNFELHARPPHHETFRASSSCSTHRKSRRMKSAYPRLVRWEPECHDYESDDEEGFDSVSLPGTTHNRPPSKFSKHEPELIKNLRKEETVAGLYSLAEELISPVKTEELVGNRKSKKTY